ncbi:hypothetical protein JXB41_04475 [Candidatus Woesearchaeota archaeon]|nr:hypothetical protein [Candidatus Woesearchaeota archaeon]
MKEIIKKDILSLLNKSIEAIKKDELLKLRTISNEVIHDASIFQDEDSISAAVVIYTVSKLHEETNIINKIVLPHLEELIAALKKNDYEAYREKIKELLTNISEKSHKTKFYISEILQRAQINKASKIYEHGISLARVAETLGVSRWELMDYIGKTTIPDSLEDISNVSDKIKFTRTLFNG